MSPRQHRRQSGRGRKPRPDPTVFRLQLVGGRRLLKVARGALGLEGEIDTKAFVRKVLESDLADLAYPTTRLTAPGYKKLPEAFGFGVSGGPRTSAAGFADRIPSATRRAPSRPPWREFERDAPRDELPPRDGGAVERGGGRDSLFSVLGSKPLREMDREGPRAAQGVRADRRPPPAGHPARQDQRALRHAEPHRLRRSRERREDHRSLPVPGAAQERPKRRHARPPRSRSSRTHRPAARRGSTPARAARNVASAPALTAAGPDPPDLRSPAARPAAPASGLRRARGTRTQAQHRPPRASSPW
ncbi:MAG: DUF1217 domain-containing protein [Rhodobacteraceae bacterium]|nr:DUF1217 domain-containing protein [Paracoccaceae bacterium]